MLPVEVMILPNTEENLEITEKRTINFTVTDGEDGISSASVTIGTTTKTTGSAGGCSFKDIDDGEVTVTVSADGFVTKTETITVSEESTSFIISLVSE